MVYEEEAVKLFWFGRTNSIEATMQAAPFEEYKVFTQPNRSLIGSIAGHSACLAYEYEDPAEAKETLLNLMKARYLNS